jgi:hypothetical protein
MSAAQRKSLFKLEVTSEAMRAAAFISFWRERKANFKNTKENRKTRTEKKKISKQG